MTLCLKALTCLRAGCHKEWSWPNNEYSHADIYLEVIHFFGGKTFISQNDVKFRERVK